MSNSFLPGLSHRRQGQVPHRDRPSVQDQVNVRLWGTGEVLFISLIWKLFPKEAETDLDSFQSRHRVPSDHCECAEGGMRAGVRAEVRGRLPDCGTPQLQGGVHGSYRRGLQRAR